MDQQEHGVHAEAQGEKGDDLGAGSIEADSKESCQAHTSSDTQSNQEDTSKAQPCLGPDSI